MSNEQNEAVLLGMMTVYIQTTICLLSKLEKPQNNSYD